MSVILIARNRRGVLRSTLSRGSGSAATLSNFDTISGAGTIGDANLTLLNFGDIVAASLTGTELVLNTGGNTITNEAGATLEAQSGGTLEIDSNVSNSGATIRADKAEDLARRK